MKGMWWKCWECEELTGNAQVLRAQNPFDSEDTVVGCPECKSVNALKLVCDEPGCRVEVSCGFPTADGYRNTCSDHYHSRK